MNQRINRFWERHNEPSVWDKLSASRQKNSDSWISRIFPRKRKSRSPRFGVIVIVAAIAVLLMIYAVYRFQGGHGRLVGMSAERTPSKFSDDCSNRFYPLHAGTETLFGRVVGNAVKDQFYLVTIDRKGDEYLQQLEVADDNRYLPIRCKEGRIEPLAYVDWSGVFGKPIMTYKSRQVSGERLPSKLEPGKRWLAEYTIDGSSFPEDVVFGADRVVVNTDSQAAVFETLTSPAGKIKVLRVKVSEKIQYLNSKGLELAPALEQEYYEYWGEGYGLVRIHADKVNKWDYVMLSAGIRPGI